MFFVTRSRRKKQLRKNKVAQLINMAPLMSHIVLCYGDKQLLISTDNINKTHIDIQTLVKKLKTL